MKSILILVFVLAALSIAAYSLSNTKKITQITEDITLEEIEDCETIHWDETEAVFGDCIKYYNATICDDEPLNTSCYIEEQSYNYTCKTGENIIENSEEKCRDTEIKVAVDTLLGTKDYTLEYGEWGKCSYEDEQETLVITCDSKYDGNNDGICTSGESCMQFRITKDKVYTSMKNSRDDFIGYDKSFFLDELRMEGVK